MGDYIYGHNKYGQWRLFRNPAEIANMLHSMDNYDRWEDWTFVKASDLRAINWRDQRMVTVDSLKQELEALLEDN